MIRSCGCRRFQKKYELPYPILYDNNAMVSRQYGVIGVPFSVLIDRSGKVVYRSNGTPESLEAFVEKENATHEQARPACANLLRKKVCGGQAGCAIFYSSNSSLKSSTPFPPTPVTLIFQKFDTAGFLRVISSSLSMAPAG